MPGQPLAHVASVRVAPVVLLCLLGATSGCSAPPCVKDGATAGHAVGVGVGATWTYDVHEGNQVHAARHTLAARERHLCIESFREVVDNVVTSLRAQEPERILSTTTIWERVDDMAYVAMEFSDPGGARRVQTWSPPCPNLRWPAPQADWSVGCLTTLADGRAANQLTTYTFQGRRTTVVPAGSFNTTRYAYHQGSVIAGIADTDAVLEVSDAACAGLVRSTAADGRPMLELRSMHCV